MSAAVTLGPVARALVGRFRARQRVADRGREAVYRRAEVNRCPSCTRTQWLIGRKLAECAVCGTAMPLDDPAAPTRLDPFNPVATPRKDD